MINNIFGVKVCLWSLLAPTMFIVCISTAAGFFGRLWWPFELASHFRAQYFVVLLASAVLFLLQKGQPAAILAAVFALINLSVIVPFYFGGAPSAHADGRLYRALLINVNESNQAYGKVRKLIRSLEPDVAVLVEVNQTWMDELQKSQADYPFSLSLPRKDGLGIAFLSRIPFENAKIRSIGHRNIPSVVVRFGIEGQHLTIIGTHVQSPWGRMYSEYRNHELGELAQLVSSQKDPVLLLGDLNTTSWSPFFQDLLRKTGLRDSRNGFGLQPSWPTVFPPFWISIDHCLVSSGVVVHDRRIGPNIGSDHYPVVVDFSVESRPPFPPQKLAGAVL